ncbi:MAG: F0F1 ATP synthase subunit B [Nanoarchaeota archaeon]|nr:F0F1 ATP synthase subunit B [Nanoarchaeota archaeon]
MDQLLQSFGIDGRILLWQVINFGALFGILWYLLYKPVRRIMREREDKVRESLERAGNLEAKSKELEGEFKQKMTDQRKEIEEMHKRALVEQKRLRDELKEKAEEGATRILEEAKNEAKKERAEIIKGTEEDLKQLAVMLAGKILEKEIDGKKEEEMLKKAIEEFKKK